MTVLVGACVCTDWVVGDCDAACNQQGVQTRTRSCNNNGGCVPQSQFSSRTCFQACK